MQLTQEIMGVREMESLKSFDAIRNVRYFECFKGVFLDTKNISNDELMEYMRALYYSLDVEYIIEYDINKLRRQFTKALQLQVDNLVSENEENLQSYKYICNLTLKAFGIFDDEELRIFLFNFAKRNEKVMMQMLMKIY